MANGVTSQWDDIHVKLGNYEPHAVVISQKEIREDNYEKMENFHPLDNKDAEELDSLDDEIEAELRKMYKSMIPKLLHNYNHITKISKFYNKLNKRLAQ